MQVEAEAWIARDVQEQLGALYMRETLPFQDMIMTYMCLLENFRDLQVRTAQLDKEAAELRDETAHLEQVQNQMGSATAQGLKQQEESLQAQLAAAQAQLSEAYKEKAAALQDVVSATSQVAPLKEQVQGLAAQLAQVTTERSQLQAQLAAVQAELEQERAARHLAASEVEAAGQAAAAAKTAAERAVAENAALVGRLMDLKAREAEKLNEINNMHEELLANAKRMKAEAEAERQAAELLRRRASAEGGPSSLRQLMGLPDAGAAAAPTRSLPAAATRAMVAHAGGCTSLSMERGGHLVASGGADRTARVWDLLLGQQVHTLQGMLAAVNDVAFTADGRQLLGAGSDKSLRLWDMSTGKTRHTLTGHGNAVQCVAACPADVATAYSTGEDRCIKLWDLARGYCVRSVPCAKMPSALTTTNDPNIIATGHLDGTLCLWDVRQLRSGSLKPLAEVRDHEGCVMALAQGAADGVLLSCCRDNVVRLWDMRQLGTARRFRHASFTAGSFGSMGKGKCHVEMSMDGRYIAAGSADGSVVVWDVLGQPKRSSDGGGTPTAGSSSSSPAGVTVLRHHKDAVVACAWSSDCSTLVTGDKAGQMAFWQCV